MSGLILTRRGSFDRDSLREMLTVLEAGKRLALFPEGGTWNKRLDDVKTGTVYLSVLTGVPIIPISIGGTYQVWHRIIGLKRPEISFNIGEPIAAPKNLNASGKHAGLRSASLELMQEIFSRLPEVDQSFNFEVLAERVSKPNLLSPLHRNARLNRTPFVKLHKYYDAVDFKKSAELLLDALSND